MINGGTIKGDATYENGTISYLQLKQELPFPTKMIVVSMPGATLRDAICASRSGDPNEEKRAYLQLDDGVEVVHEAPSDPGGDAEAPEHEYRASIRIGGKPLNPLETYSVALPRNLVKGAFKIKPLMEFGKIHAADLPTEDKCAEHLQTAPKSGQCTRSHAQQPMQCLLVQMRGVCRP